MLMHHLLSGENVFSGGHNGLLAPCLFTVCRLLGVSALTLPIVNGKNPLHFLSYLNRECTFGVHFRLEVAM